MTTQAPPPALSTASSSDGKATSGSWYTAYGIPAVAPASISTYTFTSKSLEGQVFTHSSFSPGWGVQAPVDNSTLTWLGAPIINTLISFAITALFPSLSQPAITDLRNALTSRALHAHLCRLLQLPQYLRTSSPTVLQSDRVLAELFEAFIAGVAKDLGLGRWEELYRFYFQLLEPFIHAFHALYHQHLSAPSREKRRQELAPWTSKLMEYAAKNKLEPPKFEFESNGAQGQEITWSCIVVLGGRQVARGTAGSKLEAKHIASADAMRALPQHGGDQAALNQRRKKKELFRKAARGRGGGAVGMQPMAGHVGAGMPGGLGTVGGTGMAGLGTIAGTGMAGLGTIGGTGMAGLGTIGGTGMAGMTLLEMFAPQPTQTQPPPPGSR
ncbi:ribonuclease III domain-containing protein [Sphaerosporella brunnea]|uniref:Ribonuclease III domain-containing protein n=1 Tax=Sphaerosporella brunnea TaxID=1250544 RepID=A0A5J5EU75_9PEZI|nr:ribonuclease III domain-containing protein [Sphaerosporella brunnea]